LETANGEELDAYRKVGALPDHYYVVVVIWGGTTVTARFTGDDHTHKHTVIKTVLCDPYTNTALRVNLPHI